MLEVIAVLLVVSTAALAWVALRQRGQMRDMRATLATVRATLASRQSALTALDGTLRKRDAALVSLQQSLATGNIPEADSNTYVNQSSEFTRQIAMMNVMLNATDDALIIVDEAMGVVLANSATATIFGSAQAGVHLETLTASPSIVSLVENVLAYHDDVIEEQVTIDDDIYLVRARFVPLGSDSLVCLTLNDITHLVRLNRSRRDMVANISHELRHPIANIRLIIDGLFHDQDKPKRKESISSLRAIAHETDLLLWLVQSMADLSMIESGQAIVRMVEVNFHELVDGAVERLVNQTERKHLTIVKHIPAKLTVLCDRDLIQRVVVNLLHNAMKWSPEGGAVTIEAETSAEEVVVSVLDNGPGVSPDQVERIFERFYQVDPSRSGKDGTGLGLAICKHIVTAHGGRIWAESNELGGGGRFRFSLLNADPAIAAVHPNGASRSGS
ncbi:MAG: hypothetical protein IPM16_04965 [Chloroflexi bacterium]|nr:hypothetical protein [Chloroflexota bacterium]